MLKEFIMLLVVLIPTIALLTIFLRFMGRIYWKAQIMKLKEKKQTKAIFWKYLLFGSPPTEYLVLTGKITQEEADAMVAQEKLEREEERPPISELPISEEQMEIVMRKKQSNGPRESEEAL